METDSLIFLNSFSLKYIYGDDMENTLNVYDLLSRWDCFSKHNETLFDRTNTINSPLRITNI